MLRCPGFKSLVYLIEVDIGTSFSIIFGTDFGIFHQTAPTQTGYRLIG
jgi:hypothetical protein